MPRGIIRLCLLGLGLLASAEGPAADLLEVYREAVVRDAQYASAKAAYSAAQEKLPQGRAGLLPSVSLSANSTYNDRDFQSRGAPGTPSAQFNSNAVSVTATQPLYRKQNFVVYEQSKLQVAQAETQFRSAGQDLILRVAQAYFDVLLAENNVQLAAAQKAAIAEQLAQAKRNFEVGTATITDTHEAQARFDLLAAQEIAAINDLEIRRRALEQITGRPTATLKPVGEKLGLKLPEPNAMDSWVEAASANSPQVAVQQTALDIAAQEVERNRGGHYPTIDLVATYSDTGQGAGTFGGSGFDVTTKSLGLQLALPLYQGGGQQSRVREALANQDKAREDLENTRRSVALVTRQAFLGVTSGIAQVKALEQALTSTQSQVDSTKLGQEVGVRTGVDVLNAQQQLYSARRDLYSARYNYLLSHLRLKAAAGTLAEEDLKAVNDTLR